MQVLRSLGLTQEQWQMARRLHQKLGPQMQQLHDELEERQDAFNQAMFSDPYNPKLIEERLQAVLEKQQQVMRAQMEMERGFREILTPAQLERFRELQNRQLEIRRLERQIREQQRHLMQDLQPATR
jgi:Spy/CpxP family protein refolding chaperone